MSGHSKWSKIKHQKGVTDAVKGKIFTKMANAIIIAVRQGGGNPDPDTNFKLRMAVDKARLSNMPKDKIERAVERGSGKGEGSQIEETVYEAFGPSGVGIIITAATDSKSRTVAEVKNILERNGGVLAGTGAVSHMFTFVGQITVEKNGKSSDEIMEIAIEAGVEDIEDMGDVIELFTQHNDVHKIKELLTQKNLKVTGFELIYRPIITITVSEKNKAEHLLKLLSGIEEIDDVQKVFSNFDMPEELMG